MSFWSRLLGYSTKEEMAGKCMEDPDPWLVLPKCTPATVLRSLPILFPSGGFVYFEDITEESFEFWLSDNSVPPPIKIALGTIWPKPRYYHIPLTPDVVSQAAVRVDGEKIVLPSIHLHVHDGERVLCQWHDAFEKEPMLVSSAIPRENIEAFVRAVGATGFIRCSEEEQKR